MQTALAIDLEAEWEKWATVDPYFGVLTANEYRRANLSYENRQSFFRTGELHVDHVLSRVSRTLGRPFFPDSVLDFGCGVGRLVVPFSKVAQRVVGVDISRTMLAEAKANCNAFGVGNAEFRLVDDTLDSVDGQFDFINSFIVFQHIPPVRGLEILRRLLSKIAPGGCAAIHVTYGRSYGQHDFGAPVSPVPPDPPIRSLTLRQLASAAKARVLVGLNTREDRPELPADVDANPFMPMFSYELGKVIYVFQEAGFTRVDTDLIDHAGELGALMYVVRPLH
jgi:SAM-dependent methyltransferase